MTSQPSYQTIKIHILPTVSQKKSNQLMKFGQLINYKKVKYFFSKNHAENEVGFCFLKIFCMK